LPLEKFLIRLTKTAVRPLPDIPACPKSERRTGVGAEKFGLYQLLTPRPDGHRRIVGVNDGSAYQGASRVTVQADMAGTRKPKPTRVLISCELLTPINTVRVTLRDISKTSAHVIGARTVPADCDAILRRGPLFAAVRVVSVKDNEAQLKFYRQLSLDEIGAILPGNPR
jgi:hypothetical protein